MSVQKASWVNQAYDILKSPVTRAQYLLELQGVDPNLDSHISRDSNFLMQQMMLREKLQDIENETEPFGALEEVAMVAREKFNELEADFSAAMANSDYENAREVVVKMQFFAKFLREIDEVEARLDT